MSRELNRRAVLAGTAALVPAAALAATPALTSPDAELIALIEANKAAGLVLHEASTEEEADLDEPSRALLGKPLTRPRKPHWAVCGYRCRTLDEARIKAKYLVSISTVTADLTPKWFIVMLLRSFLAEGDLRAMRAAS